MTLEKLKENKEQYINQNGRIMVKQLLSDLDLLEEELANKNNIDIVDSKY